MVAFIEVRDSLSASFREAWLASGRTDETILWDNINQDVPVAPTPWARVSIRNGLSETAAIGNRLYKRTGFLLVQFYTPIGNGLSLSDELVKLVLDKFECGCSLPGLLFRDSQVVENGYDRAWFETNVTLNFEYRESK